jgi:hypothetical protein
MLNSSRILTFEGNSLISRGISTFTGSDQTHVAWQTPDGTLWEAVDDGFKATPAVAGDRNSPLRRYHGKGVVVHAFEYQPWCRLNIQEEALALTFLKTIENTPYGFRTLFTFMLHPGKDPETTRLICSEAVLGISIAARRPLLERIRPWKCSPANIFHSPLLGFLETIVL